MTQPAGEYDFIHRIVSTSPIPVDMSQHPDSLLSFCTRNAGEERWRGRVQRRVATSNLHDSCTGKGRAQRGRAQEGRGGEERRRRWQDGVRGRRSMRLF